MKRRAYPILVIALAATGCGAAVDNPDPGPGARDLRTLNQELSTTSLQDALARREYFRPLCDAKGYPLVADIDSKEGTTATAFCEAVRANPAAPVAACDLDKVNQELEYLSLDDAIQNRSHFRCLCDAEGYPLVGNLNGKVVTTASEFCQVLRDDGL